MSNYRDLAKALGYSDIGVKRSDGLCFGLATTSALSNARRQADVDELRHKLIQELETEDIVKKIKEVEELIKKHNLVYPYSALSPFAQVIATIKPFFETVMLFQREKYLSDTLKGLPISNRYQRIEDVNVLLNENYDDQNKSFIPISEETKQSADFGIYIQSESINIFDSQSLEQYIVNSNLQAGMSIIFSRVNHAINFYFDGENYVVKDHDRLGKSSELGDVLPVIMEIMLPNKSQEIITHSYVLNSQKPKAQQEPKYEAATIENCIKKTSAATLLLLAAQRNYTNAVKAYLNCIINSLLPNDSKVQLIAYQGTLTPLALAIMLGHVELTKIYMDIILGNESFTQEEKLKLLKTEDGLSVLTSASDNLETQAANAANLYVEAISNSSFSDEEKAELIIAKNADGKPALLLPISTGNAELFDVLIQSILKASFIFQNEKLKLLKDEYGISILSRISLLGKAEIAGFFIDAVVDSSFSDEEKAELIIAKNFTGEPALLSAIDNPEMFSVLIQAILKAPFIPQNEKLKLLKNKNGVSILSSICQTGDARVANVFIEAILNSSFSNEDKSELILAKNNKNQTAIKLASLIDNADMTSIICQGILKTASVPSNKKKLKLCRSLLDDACYYNNKKSTNALIQAIVNSPLTKDDKLSLLIANNNVVSEFISESYFLEVNNIISILSLLPENKRFELISQNISSSKKIIDINSLNFENLKALLIILPMNDRSKLLNQKTTYNDINPSKFLELLRFLPASDRIQAHNWIDSYGNNIFQGFISELMLGTTEADNLITNTLKLLPMKDHLEFMKDIYFDNVLYQPSVFKNLFKQFSHPERLTVTNQKGDTIVHHMIRSHASSIMTLLPFFIEQGYDLKTKNADGLTVIEILNQKIIIAQKDTNFNAFMIEEYKDIIAFIESLDKKNQSSSQSNPELPTMNYDQSKLSDKTIKVETQI
ncbi:hypothetical protein L3V79_00200 [Thiotrichales bacterium 19S9-12]|nr:hypothetical protein [Thiotrichales bacterium 19S9-11]MCF6810787.1 hypothetical protein [Thiotrichales bacterium 19S9-12]